MNKSTLNGRCATCKHWRGDKEEASQMFKENPLSMCECYGWAPEGKCAIIEEYSSIDISGDARVDIYVNANHGCIRWKS